MDMSRHKLPLISRHCFLPFSYGLRINWVKERMTCSTGSILVGTEHIWEVLTAFSSKARGSCECFSGWVVQCKLHSKEWSPRAPTPRLLISVIALQTTGRDAAFHYRFKTTTLGGESSTLCSDQNKQRSWQVGEERKAAPILRISSD